MLNKQNKTYSLETVQFFFKELATTSSRLLLTDYNQEKHMPSPVQKKKMQTMTHFLTDEESAQIGYQCDGGIYVTLTIFLCNIFQISRYFFSVAVFTFIQFFLAFQIFLELFFRFNFDFPAFRKFFRCFRIFSNIFRTLQFFYLQFKPPGIFQTLQKKNCDLPNIQEFLPTF